MCFPGIFDRGQVGMSDDGWYCQAGDDNTQGDCLGSKDVVLW
jgi:hypothetical protein